MRAITIALLAVGFLGCADGSDGDAEDPGSGPSTGDDRGQAGNGPEPTSGAPKPVSGTPEPASGTPKPASGTPKPASGTPKPASGTPEPTGGASKPTEARCEVTISTPSMRGSTPKTDVWSYDPATRRLMTTVYGYDLDEAGRTYKVYGNQAGELVLYWTNHYDSHGQIDRYEHYTSGAYTFTNSYDGDRLIAREMAAHDTQPATRNTYRYEDPSAPAIWTHNESDVLLDGTIEAEVERTIEDGRTALVTFKQTGDVRHQFRFLYDGERIDAIERDGGFFVSDKPDDEPDIRWTWTRDDDGNVIEYAQDGTDSFDNPFVDGSPDYLERYSQGCAPLLKQFPWLAHEPASNSTGPRGRDDSD